MKIIFAGTPAIAAGVLAKILAAGFSVPLVLTQPDRPAGRGMKLSASAVKELAVAAGIEVFQPESLKNNPAAVHKLALVAADILVVVAYGLILPEAILAVPRRGAVNLHVSLLPKWRGAAPIQRALLAGDKYSGVSLMQMDKGLDSGAILDVATLELAPDETSGSLHDKLALLGAAKIVKFLANPDNFTPQAQDPQAISYAAKITKAEAQINWAEAAALIERKIRGYNPFPGAFSYVDGVLYKIWQAQLITSSTTAVAGTILEAPKGQVWVAAGDGGIVALREIQAAGGKRSAASLMPRLVGKQFKTRD